MKKVNKEINQDSIDKKLELDHTINELVSNHLDEFDNDGLAAVKYIRKEVKRIHKGLKKYVKTGKLA